MTLAMRNDIGLEDFLITLNSFADDFKNGCLIDRSIFLNIGSFEFAYIKFFSQFSTCVKNRCFCKCIDLLNINLGFYISRLLKAYEQLALDNPNCLLGANKYFSVSNFYASIYREMDYDFFVCFDEYLKRNEFFEYNSVKYGLNKIRFIDVFDNTRFGINGSNTLVYLHNYSYGSFFHNGFSSTDGLRLLASFKNEGDSDKIFSYLLSKYRFEFHDMIYFVEVLFKRDNFNFLGILFDKYNFWDERNCVARSEGVVKHSTYVKEVVRDVLRFSLRSHDRSNYRSNYCTGLINEYFFKDRYAY